MKNKKIFSAAAFDKDDISIDLIAYNKREKTALLEVIKGQVLGAGWHAVIKREGSRWRLISDNNVWVH